MKMDKEIDGIEPYVCCQSNVLVLDGKIHTATFESKLSHKCRSFRIITTYTHLKGSNIDILSGGERAFQETCIY